MMRVVPTTTRVIWTGTDEPRAEVCELELRPDGLVATGIQIGWQPDPYRLDYRVVTRGGFVTRLLDARVQGGGWQRQLRLEHDGDGRWNVDDPDALGRAVDCDLGFSPLTNLMPVRRHHLHEQPGAAEIVVAWVSVPDLTVRPSAQRYEHVRRTGHGAVVRFVDQGLFEGFTADLEVDGDGLVVSYPGLADRVS